MQHEIEQIKEWITRHPDSLPDLLTHIGNTLSAYRESCEKRNNHLLREALGDAVLLLGLNRRPRKDIMTKLCTHIREAIFKDGLTDYHHAGEQRFYEKYLA
jgi:hypothetical protein